MNISYNWLRDYVDLPNEVSELSEVLTMLGFEVDEVISVGSSMDGIVIGEIKDVSPHPDADKLRLCQVSFGEGDSVQIVCGAPNVAAGQFVPVATVGTVLTVPSKKEEGVMEEIVLKKAKLRGQESNGMICSEAELGISEEHDGIMVLDEKAKAGTHFVDYLKSREVESSDSVFDIALTPNRPDGTSHLGVARDLAAKYGKDLRYPEVYQKQVSLDKDGGVDISIEDADGCHRYVGIVIKGVKVQESPPWLKSRLSAIGLRPINNIVDITNFVMYECGQPLHAFDLSKVRGQKIVVKACTKGEKFKTLDDKEHELPENTLMICDGEGSVAIAGVMGGQNSEVDLSSSDILLEAAYFSPSRVRKAAKLLSIQTDASYRFERGVDPSGTLKAANRAAHLILDVGGGELVGGVDVIAEEFRSQTISIRPSRVEKLLGFAISAEEILSILNSIEIESELVGENEIKSVIPGFRPDIEREIDLIEEVVRLYGYDKVELPTQVTIPAALPKSSKTDTKRISVLEYLAGRGFREIYTNSLIPLDRGQLFVSESELVETVNPISRENASLRPSMLAGILPVVKYNRNRGHKSLRFAEFGYVFSKTNPEDTSNLVPGYYQREVLAMVFSGAAQAKSWNQEEREGDFYDAKKEVSDLLVQLGLASVELGKKSKVSENGNLEIIVHAEKKRLGILGMLGDQQLKAFDLAGPVYFAELDWSRIGKILDRKKHGSVEEINRFPSVDRDIAMIVDKGVRAGDMMDSIKQACPQILSKTEVFDLYSGENLGESRKSIAFSLTFSANKTLKDQEVDKKVDRIIERLKKDFGAEIRS